MSRPPESIQAAGSQLEVPADAPPDKCADTGS